MSDPNTSQEPIPPATEDSGIPPVLPPAISTSQPIFSSSAVDIIPGVAELAKVRVGAGTVATKIVLGREIARPPAPGVITLTAKPPAAPPPRLRPRLPSGAVDPGDSNPTAIHARPSPTLPAQPGGDAAEMLSQANWEARSNLLYDPGSDQALEDAAYSSSAIFSAHGLHRVKSIIDPLHVRRTVIPVFLTLCTILAVTGIYLLAGGPDNALADLFPAWAGYALLALSGISLGGAILNMFTVRNALRRNGSHRSAGPASR